MLMEPTVLAALIRAAGTVTAALIAALIASMVGRQISGRQLLRTRLREAIDDIHFLLEVESTHADLHVEAGDSSNKQRVRQLVRSRGFTWSGRYTPGRVKRLDDLLNN